MTAALVLFVNPSFVARVMLSAGLVVGGLFGAAVGDCVAPEVEDGDGGLLGAM